MAQIVKSGSSSPRAATPSGQASALAGFNLDDLADEGRRRLQQCQQQIEQMLSAAQAEAQQIKEQAQQQGYQDGLEKAEVDTNAKIQAEALRRTKEGLKSIDSAVNQMRRLHESWMNQYAQSLQTISMAIAEKITRRKLQQESSLITTWAKEAIESTRSATKVTIALHPETLVQVGEQIDQLLASPDTPENAQLIPDDSLDLGDVAVRQHGGEIQAGLNAQLERLSELL